MLCFIHTWNMIRTLELSCMQRSFGSGLVPLEYIGLNTKPNPKSFSHSFPLSSPLVEKIRNSFIGSPCASFPRWTWLIAIISAVIFSSRPLTSHTSNGDVPPVARRSSAVSTGVERFSYRNERLPCSNERTRLVLHCLTADRRSCVDAGRDEAVKPMTSWTAIE